MRRMQLNAAKNRPVRHKFFKRMDGKSLDTYETNKTLTGREPSYHRNNHVLEVKTLVPLELMERLLTLDLIGLEDVDT
jgi:hypothetical protein